MKATLDGALLARVLDTGMNNQRLGYLTRANPGVRDVEALRDIRRVVIEELGRQRPTSAQRG